MTTIAEITQSQIGGTHYAVMGMTPFEFAMRNGWDATAFSILKYLSRYRRKDGLKDLEKSAHIVEIRRQLLDQFECVPLTAVTKSGPVTMGAYIHENGINVEDGTALMALDAWVRGVGRVGSVRTTINSLIGQHSVPC